MPHDLPFEEVFPRYRRLMESVAAFRQAGVIMAGAERGVFDALDGSPRTAGEVAEALALPLRGVTVLLDALAGLGLLRKDGNRYGKK